MKSDKQEDEQDGPSLLKNAKLATESVLLGRDSMGNNRDSMGQENQGRKSTNNKDGTPDSSPLKKNKQSLPKAGEALQKAVDRFSLSNSASSLSNDSIKAINIEKRIESRYFPFVSNGIKKEKFTTLAGLSYNLLWLGRFCLINICISAMQLSPGSQVFSILAINTAFGVFFCRSIFKQKMFSTGKTHMLGSIMLEFTLQMFFIASVVFYFNDLYEILDAQTFFVLQVICVILIYLGILMEVAGLLVEMWSNYKEFRERKKAELEKAQELKKKEKQEKEHIAEERNKETKVFTTAAISVSKTDWQNFNSTEIKL